MDTNKTITILGSIFIIMFLGTFWTWSFADAWKNSPNEFAIRFEIENNTQEVLKDLNGSIIINNYYGNFTNEITMCKEYQDIITIKDNGEILKQERFEKVYNCTFI